jgi:hypothetical protein
MKYTLLGTTALVAAGLVGGQAYAAEGGVKLGLGGFYEGAYGSTFDTDDSGEGGTEDTDADRSDSIGQQIEVYFSGEATLDNGLSVGARIELEGQTRGDQIDAAYAYFSGGFGDFTIGDRGDALSTLCYIIPRAAHLFGAESPDFSWDNSGVFGYGRTNGTCYGIADKSTELMYISPNFAGFTFAASYKPDGTEDTDGAGRPDGFATSSDSDSPYQDSEDVSVAAQFDRDFNGVHVVVGGGAAWSFDVEGTGLVDDPDGREDYQAYLTVGFGLGDGTLTVGGTWGLRENIRVVTSDPATFDVNTGTNEVFGVGVTYNLDAWTVGAGWTEGQYDSCGDNGECDDTHDVISLDASYALGPGVAVEGTVNYHNYDSDTSDAADLEGFAGGAGLWIGF